MLITRNIYHDLYPRQAIAEAREAFRDYCTLEIRPLPGNAACIGIRILSDHESDGRQIVLEFLNYALDRSMELQLKEH